MDMEPLRYVMMVVHIVHMAIQPTVIILILEEAGVKAHMAILHMDIVTEVMEITPTGHIPPMEILVTALLTPGSTV